MLSTRHINTQAAHRPILTLLAFCRFVWCSYFAGPDDARPKGTIDMTGVLRIEGEQTWPGKGKGDHNFVR